LFSSNAKQDILYLLFITFNLITQGVFVKKEEYIQVSGKKTKKGVFALFKQNKNLTSP